MPPNSVTLRDIEGQAFDVPVEEVQSYLDRGWSEESSAERGARVTSEVQDDLYGGVGGAAKTIAAGVLSGVTLGGSDAVFGALGGRQAIKGLQAENPALNIGSNIVGAALPAIVSGGATAPAAAAKAGIGARILAATPAGVVSKLGTKIAAKGAVPGAGVLAGVGYGAAGAAVEGALQSGGQYLAQTALEDKPLSAEGFVAAMGKGALFAAPIGGVISGASSALQRARSLFPKQEVTRDAAKAVNAEATDAIQQAVTEGDAMVAAAKQRIELIETKVGMASAGEGTTRRMFGAADPQAIDDQVVGAVDAADLKDAVRKYEASKANLDDWIRNEVDPDLEAALLALEPPRVNAEMRRSGAVWPPEPSDAVGFGATSGLTAEDATRVGKTPARAPVGVPNDLLKGLAPQAAPFRPSADPTEFAKQIDQVYAGMPANEIDAVNHLSSGGYKTINPALRDNVDSAIAPLMPEIKVLDQAIAKAATDSDIRVYRGLEDVSDENLVERFRSMKPGETFTDRAFVSTSTRPDDLKAYEVRMTIDVPKGTNMLPVKRSDNTLLLPRGLKFRVDSNKVVNETIAGRSRPMVEMQLSVVPSGAADAVGPTVPFRKISRPAGGSQGGAWYADEAGEQWFGKSYGGNVDRVEGEHVANRVYRLFGVDVPETKIVDIDGKRVMMSKDVGGAPAGSPSALTDTNAVDGFVVDAWLANWDVTGFAFDNMLVNGRRAARVDNGGSTIWRAQGAPKTFRSPVKELDSLRDPQHQAGKVFGQLSQPEIDQQLIDFADRYKTLRSDVDRIVDESQLSTTAKEKIKSGLQERAQWLVEQAKKLRGNPSLRPDEFRQLSKTAEQGWGEPTRAGVRDYVDDVMFDDVNEALRTGNADSLPQRWKTSIDAVDRAIARSAAPRDIAVFRGVRAGPDGEFDVVGDLLAKLKPGDQYTDPGFHSTSSSPQVARKFAAQKSASGKPNAEIQIDIPKGHPAAALTGKMTEEEFEVLLPRNTTFKVVSSTKKPNGNVLLRVAAEPPSSPTMPTAKPLSVDEFAKFKREYRRASTADHESAGWLYSSPEYEHINSALRAGRPLGERYDKAVKALDEAIALPDSVIPRDTILYRGLSGADAKARFGSLKPGDVVEDKAFFSTSASETSKVRNEDVVFNIRTPAGTRAAAIPSLYDSELELLLPRGTRFRVDSNKMVPQVPTAARWVDAIDHEVHPDGSVTITTPDGDKSKYPPIRELDVTLLNETSAAIPSRVALDLSIPIEQLSKRQLSEMQDLINARFDSIPSEGPEYDGLAAKWDAIVERRKAIESGAVPEPKEWAPASSGGAALTSEALEEAANFSLDSPPPELPSGFSLTAKSDGNSVFNSNPTVRIGVPDLSKLSRETYRDIAYVVTPTDLADRRVLGIRSGGDMPTDARTVGIQKAWDSGEAVPAVEIDVDPAGRMFVADGNHRLYAAASDGDRPIVARFRPVEASVAGMDDIADDIARAAGRAPAPSGSLEGLLRGTKAQLDAGATLGQVSAASPLRKAYVIGKELDSGRPLTGGAVAMAHEGDGREGFAQFQRRVANDATNVGRVRAAPPAASASAADDGSLEALLRGTKAHLDAGGDLKSARRAAPSADDGPTGLEGLLNAQRRVAGDMTLVRPGMTFGTAERTANDNQIWAALQRNGIEGPPPSSAGIGQRVMASATPAEQVAKIIAKRPGGDVDIGPSLEKAARAIGDFEAAGADLVRVLGPAAPAGAQARAKAYQAATAGQADAAAAAAAKVAATVNAKAPLPAATGGGLLSKLADAGTAIEALSAMGVRTPSLGSIPVIGPLLSLFFKARAVMGIVGRKGGSIVKSVDGTVAERAAQVRNRIRAATTAALTVSARGAKRAAAASGGVAGVLAYKLFPGGDEPKSKDVRALYDARMSELARAQAPRAIADAVAERYPTSDAALQDAITAQVERGLRFLDSKAPKRTTMPGMLKSDGKWYPSKVALEKWARYIEAVNDPAKVLEDLAKGHVTIEGAETLRVVYPRLFAEAQRALLEAAPQIQQTLPYSRRVMLSIMFRVPVDGSMTPENLQFLQPQPPAGDPAGAPTGVPAPAPATGPALSGPLSLGQQTMTSLDRRAGM